MMKRLTAIVMALMLLIACISPALAAAPKIKRTDYEGNGIVEIDFNSKKVSYRNVKVTVKDASGKKLSAKVIEKDNDDLSFRVSGVKAGAKYAFTISGVRNGSTGSYGKVSGSFKVPGSKPKIKKVTYDPSDRELEIDFATRVQFKGLKVVVKDSNGKKLSVKILEKGSDDLDVRVSGMKKGKRYTVAVSGVRVKGKGEYIRISKSFVA